MQTARCCYIVCPLQLSKQSSRLYYQTVSNLLRNSHPGYNIIDLERDSLEIGNVSSFINSATIYYLPRQSLQWTTVRPYWHKYCALLWRGILGSISLLPLCELAWPVVLMGFWLTSLDLCPSFLSAGYGWRGRFCLCDVSTYSFFQFCNGKSILFIALVNLQ